MAPILFVLFLVVPLVELFFIVQVADVIGGWSTVGLLLLMSVAGAALVKREGLRAWSRFRAALGAPRIPAEEVVDGALVVLAGALMLTPGFFTDVVGLLLVLPPTRALVNRVVRGRVRVGLDVRRQAPPGRARRGAQRDGVVDVEVVEVRRDDGPPPEARR